MIYLIPIGRLDRTIARMLAYRFEQIRICKFPENLFFRFKQVVVFGVCKKAPSMEENIAESLKAIGTGMATVPFLAETPESIYEVPCSPDLKNFLFRTSKINPDELEEEIKAHGLDKELPEMTNGRSREGRMVSIMPLRLGHLAQVIACGSLKGVVFDQNQRNPMIVKGITRKVVDSRIEREGNKEREIQTERIVITINAFNKAGELITIQ